MYILLLGDENTTGGAIPTGDYIMSYNAAPISQQRGTYASKNKNAAALFAVTTSSSGEVYTTENRGGINLHYGKDKSWSEGCLVTSEENLKKIAEYTNKSNVKIEVIE